jgi:hypothetical protein
LSRELRSLDSPLKYSSYRIPLTFLPPELSREVDFVHELESAAVFGRKLAGGIG